MNVPYKIPDDFTPISVVTLVPEALVAHPSLGVKTLPELIALAKRQPGRINIGTAGSAGISQLAAELFKAQTGIDITVVPYRGAAPAVVDLLGNSIQLLFADLPVILPHIRSNALVPVVLASRQRSPPCPICRSPPSTASRRCWRIVVQHARPGQAAGADPGEAVGSGEDRQPDAGGAGRPCQPGRPGDLDDPGRFHRPADQRSEVWRRVAQAANIRAD
ncbi:Bug family tripartite tricarboxylate transporter substrate binding protein [Siccirubricoccus deserti]